MREEEGYYVIDTCSLVDLNKFNPIDLYPSVWEKLEILIKKKKLYAPIEVFNELSKQDDSVFEWAKKHKSMFLPITKKQIEIVTEILQKFPEMLKVERQYDADPWVIALTIELRMQKQLIPVTWLIVTEEQIRGNKLKIPFICKDYKINCLKIFDMFRERGWKF